MQCSIRHWKFPKCKAEFINEWKEPFVTRNFGNTLLSDFRFEKIANIWCRKKRSGLFSRRMLINRSKFAKI